MTLAMAMTLAPAAKTFLAKARENWAKKDWRPALSAAINPHPACQSHFSSIFCSSQSHFFDFFYQSVLDRTIDFWRCQNKYLWHKVKGIRFAAVFDADYCHYWLNRKAWGGRVAEKICDTPIYWRLPKWTEGDVKSDSSTILEKMGEPIHRVPAGWNTKIQKYTS